VKYEIRASAARDIDRAAGWYGEHSTDPRMAVRFLLELRGVFEMIVAAPEGYPIVHRDVRRCRMLAFPAYSVFYRVLPHAVVITAVFHGRRRDLGWKHRR
jgi:plasmid stabilization system protein ParE